VKSVFSKDLTLMLFINLYFYRL